MIEPRKANFRPRWMDSPTTNDLRNIEDHSWIGGKPLDYARIVVRLMPSRSSSAISARTLWEVVEHAQKLSSYATYDVANSPNPDFADLRSMGADLAKFSNLTIEPFEEGSFVIPTRLEAAPMELAGETNRTITTDDLVKRFQEILLSLNQTSSVVTDISIGALQTIDSFNKVLDRAQAKVELASSTSWSESLPVFESSDEFQLRVEKVLVNRRPTLEKLESIEGRITAFDILKGELMLSVDGLSNRVKGTFSKTLQTKLMLALDQRVRLLGFIERRGNNPKRINIQDTELLDAD